MKLGILGYFGFGNYGDELFHQVWNHTFSDADVITFEQVTGIAKCMHSEPEDRVNFVEQIQHSYFVSHNVRNNKFLQSKRLMDYSLLLAVEKVND